MSWFRTKYTIQEIDEIRRLIAYNDDLEYILKWGYQVGWYGDKDYADRVERRLRTYLEAGVPVQEFRDQNEELKKLAQEKNAKEAKDIIERYNYNG